MGSHHAAGTAAAASLLEPGGFSPAPRLVQWMVTLRCSMHCPHCSAAPEATPGWRGAGELTLAEAARLLDEVAALGVHEVLLTGGEPLDRPDLPAIIRLLGERKQRWSLDTARHPSAACREAVRAWPPAFVAVSLDGPEELHDELRGRGRFADAMRAIAWFSELTSGQVAAGTTVTRRNAPALAETFRVVAGSGARSWGLHLAVPEGRAATRPDLLLDGADLRRLLSFVDARRSLFPVVLADEAGFCGEWEPRVRAAPFSCGAGRVQCVVLPDGEVVPCTTLDRRASAGNVRARPLAEIWRDGFAELRGAPNDERCKSCEWAPACGGGCWLMRRHGQHCWRDEWTRPRTHSSRAALAVCLGLAACGGGAPKRAATPDATAPASAPAATMGKRWMTPEGIDAAEWAIVRWYAAQWGGRMAPTLAEVREEIRTALPGDPAGDYLLSLIDGPPPADLATRVARVRAALKTPQRSLALVALAWRDLAEWCLDAAPAARRTPAERVLLHDALAELAATGAAWREEIFTEKLDPFLARDTRPFQHVMMSKAGPPATQSAYSNVSVAHWDDEILGDVELTREYLARHPLGEPLELPVARGCGLGADVLRPFDVITVPAGGTCRATIAGFEVDLPRGADLTYADLLRLVYEQNRAALDALPSGSPAPLLVPAYRAAGKTAAALDAWLF